MATDAGTSLPGKGASGRGVREALAEERKQTRLRSTRIKRAMRRVSKVMPTDSRLEPMVLRGWS
jgi:hypothetical protein